MSFMQTSSFFVLKRRWFLRLWHVYWKQHSIYSIHSRVPTVYTTRYPGFHFEFNLLLWIRNSTSGLVRSSMIHSWTHLLLEQLTFQTTIRALSCGEIADDHDLVSRIKKLYDKLDAGTTPVTILMPWLPSWTMVNKLWSTKKIYDIIVKAVKQRQALLMKIEEGEKPQDTMQLLLDAGDDRMAVVGVSAFPVLLISVSRHGLGVWKAQSYMTPTIRVALINNTNSYRFQFIMGLLIAGARATGTSGKLYFSALPPIFRRIPPFQNINIHPSFILPDISVSHTSLSKYPFPIRRIPECLHAWSSMSRCCTAAWNPIQKMRV